MAEVTLRPTVLRSVACHPAQPFGIVLRLFIDPERLPRPVTSGRLARPFRGSEPRARAPRVIGEMSDPRRNMCRMKTPKSNCRCHMCDEEPGNLGLDGYMAIISDHVGRVGWAVQAVPSDDEGPAWAYSVGIWHTHGGPELVMCGAPVENMGGIINLIGQRIARGMPVEAGDQLDDIGAHTLAVRPVHQSWRMTSMFTISDCFYGYVRPLYLQIAWPDRKGRFPWEPGFDAEFDDDQPMLWLPRDDHPPGAWTRLDRLPR